MTPFHYIWVPILLTLLAGARFWWIINKDSDLRRTGHGHIVAFDLMFTAVLPFLAVWAAFVMWVLVWGIDLLLS